MPSPETELLVTIARTFIGAEDGDSLRRRAEDVRDWPAVLALADAHGVLPLACAVLDVAAAPSLGADARGTIARAGHDATLRSMRVQAEVGGVLAGLAERGERPVVLKGIATAHALYPDPALRPYGDLDLLVDEPGWTRFREAMLGLGAVPEGRDAAVLPPRLTSGDALDHHLAFSTPAGLRVDCALDPLQLGLRIRTLPEMRERAVPLVLPQAPGSLRLSPEDDLVMLLVHLNRHGFRRLVWFVDIAQLLAAHPELDWDVVAETVRREGIAVPVANTLRLAADTLDFPIPLGMSVLHARAIPSALWRHYWPASDVLGEGLHEGPLVFRKSQGDTPLPRFASWTVANLLLTGHTSEKAEYAFRKLLPRKAFLSERYGAGGGGYVRLWLRRLGSKVGRAQPRRGTIRQERTAGD